MRMRVPSLASLSGLRIWRGPELWCGPVAVALIGPLAWEFPSATSAVLGSKNKKGISYWAPLLHPTGFLRSTMWALVLPASLGTAHQAEAALLPVLWPQERLCRSSPVPICWGRAGRNSEARLSLNDYAGSHTSCPEQDGCDLA